MFETVKNCSKLIKTVKKCGAYHSVTKIYLKRKQFRVKSFEYFQYISNIFLTNVQNCSKLFKTV